MAEPARIVLREEIATGLGSDRAQAIGMNLGFVVAAVHGQEGPHGSLRPETIAVAPDNTVELRASDLDPTLSVLEELAGNRRGDVPLAQAPYVSPERARGAGPSAADDVFAIGAIVYEMLTGRPPHSGRTREEILTEINLAAPRDVLELAPETPRALARVVHRCLEPRLDDRFPSAEAVAEALERLAAPKGKHRTTRKTEALPLNLVDEPSAFDDEPSEVDDAPPVPVRPERATTGVWMAAAILAAILGVGISVYFATQSPTVTVPEVVADSQTVLILPFDIRGRTDDTSYLGQAFAESLAINLALDATLKVLPVPDGNELPPSSLRSEYALSRGAGKLLTGSVARNAGELTASLSLVDATENRIVWGATERSRGTDYTSLAVTLVQRLGKHLGSDFPQMYDYITNLTGGPSMAVAPITAAVIAALRDGNIDSAVSKSEALVAQYPEEADALALRAHALLLRWDAQQSNDNRRRLEEALDALRRIDSKSPYVSFYRAYVAYVTGNIQDAAVTYSRVLERDDLSPRARAWVLKYRASVDQALNNGAAALADIEEALRVDPANAWTLAILSETLMAAGRYEDALVRARQAINLAPTFWRNHLTLGRALANLGRWEDARAAQNTACEMSHAQMPCALYAIGLLKAGERDAAARAADEARTLAPSSLGLYNLACFYALDGDTEKSLELLEGAAELGHQEDNVRSDEDLESLRGHPRFEAIAARLAPR